MCPGRLLPAQVRVQPPDGTERERVQRQRRQRPRGAERVARQAQAAHQQGHACRGTLPHAPPAARSGRMMMWMSVNERRDTCPTPGTGWSPGWRPCPKPAAWWSRWLELMRLSRRGCAEAMCGCAAQASHANDESSLNAAQAPEQGTARCRQAAVWSAACRACGAPPRTHDARYLRAPHPGQALPVDDEQKHAEAQRVVHGHLRGARRGPEPRTPRTRVRVRFLTKAYVRWAPRTAP
jgi:hypothetical protein